MAHKHAALIRAWADGAKVQAFSRRHNRWMDSESPTWSPETEYRLKPNDHVWEAHLTYERNDVVAKMYGHSNLRLTFDASSGQLIAAEVLNEPQK